MFPSHISAQTREIIDTLPSTRGYKFEADFVSEVVQCTSFLPDAIAFLARLYCIYHNIDTAPTCITCSTVVKWQRTFKQGFQRYCSTRCKNLDPRQQQLAKAGLIDKHNVTNASQLDWVQTKKKEISLAKHGVTSPSQLLSVKEKTVATNIERYGVIHACILPSTKEKTAATNVDRYGVQYQMQRDEVKQLVQIRNHQQYDRNHHSQCHISKQSIECLDDRDWLYNQHINEHKSLSLIANALGVDMTTVVNRCRQHQIPVNRSCMMSVGETEIGNWLREVNGLDIVTNDRTIISPLELDIVIPSHNIAIEYCGLYWHSEQHKEDPNYHAAKYNACAKQGFQLITIYEDEWKNSRSIVEAKLLSLLHSSTSRRVYARSTTVHTVSTAAKKAFFNTYHIQGNGPGSVNLGLFENDVMVACMSFINDGNGRYTLNRYATSVAVIGGLSKLLTHFKRHYSWQTIVSFADCRWSNGNAYYACGFELDKCLPPDYAYVRNGKRIHKFNMRHSNLKRILPGYDAHLSERENCLNHGLHRIWDCGKLRFTLTNH